MSGGPRVRSTNSADSEHRTVLVPAGNKARIGVEPRKQISKPQRKADSSPETESKNKEKKQTHVSPTFSPPLRNLSAPSILRHGNQLLRGNSSLNASCSSDASSDSSHSRASTGKLSQRSAPRLRSKYKYGVASKLDMMVDSKVEKVGVDDGSVSEVDGLGSKKRCGWVTPNTVTVLMGSIESEDSCDTNAFMELALQEAKHALERLEVPVGCVIVENKMVIASGSNRTNETRNATRHAEMEAIDGLLQQWQRDGFSQTELAKRFSKCVLYVTCEPCIMCAAALSFVGIKEVYYGCANDKFGGCGSILSLHKINSEDPHLGDAKGYKCTGGIMASEAVSLFQTFYERGNPNAPKPHRTVVQS